MLLHLEGIRTRAGAPDPFAGSLPGPRSHLRMEETHVVYRADDHDAIHDVQVRLILDDHPNCQQGQESCIPIWDGGSEATA